MSTFASVSIDSAEMLNIWQTALCYNIRSPSIRVPDLNFVAVYLSDLMLPAANIAADIRAIAVQTWRRKLCNKVSRLIE